MIAKAFFYDEQPSQRLTNFASFDSQFMDGIKDSLSPKLLLNIIQRFFEYTHHYVHCLLCMQIFTSSFYDVYIIRIRVYELQNFVYLDCILQIIIINQMENKVPSFDDLQSAQGKSIISQERHFGNTLPLCWREDGQPKYVLGPHYLIFIFTLAITVILAIVMAVSIISSTKGRKIQISFGIILAILFYAYSYVKVGFSNPGIASSWHEAPDGMRTNLRYCVPCRIVRPVKTIHCYSCDICIYQYDHHCPWVGKCIGRDNIGSFKCFVFSVVILLVSFSLCLYTASAYQAKQIPE